MGFIITGAILIILGLILWLIRGKKADKLFKVDATDLSKVNEIIENFKGIVESHGPGNFSIYAKLKGKAAAETPQLSEFTKTNCAYFKSVVTREYEELQTTKDSNGNAQKKWVRKNEIVSSHTNTATDFAIQDDTGQILIDSTGAEMYTIKTFSKFEKGSEPQGGGLNISIGGFNVSSGSSIKTIGFKYEEFSIPLNTDLFVIGEVNDRSGRLMISKPKENSLPFIVSTKSEDEIKKIMGKSVIWLKYSSILSFILGDALLIYGIYKNFIA